MEAVVAITQRVRLGKLCKVYNRRKRLVGEWVVKEGEKGFTYSALTFDKTGEVEWDLTGSNPDYPTMDEAARAAIDNILHP